MSSPIYPDAQDGAGRAIGNRHVAPAQPPPPPVSKDALIRLKILSPLAVLVSLAANLICALAIHPTMAEIHDDYLTPVTPKKHLIGLYWLVLYVLQIGYVVLVITARKEETKRTIVNAVGLRFVFAEFLFALWPIFFALRIFPVCFVLLAVIFFLLLTVFATLVRHPPTRRRPLDFVFIHMPMRLFLLVLWNTDLWQMGSMGLRWYRYVGNDPDASDRPGRWEKHHDQHAWVLFGIILGVGLIDAFITFASKDVVWALATIYLFISVLVGPNDDSGPRIVVPLILVCVLQVVAIASAFGWHLFSRSKEQREGRIRLPQDEDEGERATTAGQIA